MLRTGPLCYRQVTVQCYGISEQCNRQVDKVLSEQCNRQDLGCFRISKHC
jgi:hypothetical protein